MLITEHVDREHANETTDDSGADMLMSSADYTTQMHAQPNT